MVTLETFRRVMLAAQIKLGKLTAKASPLALMLMAEVTLAIWVLKVFSLLLLSICMRETVSTLIPSRVLRKVFETVMLLAELTVAGKVNKSRAGRAVHAIVPTLVKSVMERVERRVKLLRVKAPPIVPMVVLPKLVSPPAFSQIRSPVTCAGPSI